MDNYNKHALIKANVNALLAQYFPQFKYSGRGAHIGVWDTPEIVFLDKPYNETHKYAKFRLWVFYPTTYGQEIKIEAEVESCDWETMFCGYIKDIIDIKQIFTFQLGIPQIESGAFATHYAGAVCPYPERAYPQSIDPYTGQSRFPHNSKKRCIGCPIGSICIAKE